MIVPDSSPTSSTSTPTPLKPGEAAGTFLELLKAGQFDEAWSMTDVEWRLVQLQQWMWAHRVSFMDPDLIDVVLDEEVAAGVADGPGRWWWPSFAAHGSRWGAEIPYDPVTWGEGSRPRPVDVDSEVVVFGYIGDDQHDAEGKVVQTGAFIDVLMRLVDGQWLVAAVNLRYRPGWPPALEGPLVAGRRLTPSGPDL